MGCFRESRTRSPSRLSRMRTTLLARLGEISIVLHAGDARCSRQEEEGEGELRQTTNTTVMERELVDVLAMTGKQASTKRNSAVMCSVVPAEAGRDFKRDEGEALVAGAHVHHIEELRCSYLQVCMYKAI